VSSLNELTAELSEEKKTTSKLRSEINIQMASMHESSFKTDNTNNNNLKVFLKANGSASTILAYEDLTEFNEVSLSESQTSFEEMSKESFESINRSEDNFLLSRKINTAIGDFKSFKNKSNTTM
jgi:hypothetical protein